MRHGIPFDKSHKSNRWTVYVYTENAIYATQLRHNSPRARAL
jgi:hypothetical protein